MELRKEVSIITKGKIILSTTLLFIGLTAFSQSKPTKNTTRPEIIYKQSHSSNDENSNLFADGIDVYKRQTMRRTKKRGLDIRICFLRIGDKIVGTMFPSLYMIKGVITRNMPFFKNLTIKRWV